MRIEPTSQFKKDIKSLKKRYKLISRDLKELNSTLLDNPTAGVPLGNNVYKIRVANSSVPTGKSGGFRVITYLIEDNTIYLITIYSKSDMANITREEVDSMVRKIDGSS